jgi:hypothetical protein
MKRTHAGRMWLRITALLLVAALTSTLAGCALVRSSGDAGSAPTQMGSAPPATDSLGQAPSKYTDAQTANTMSSEAAPEAVRSGLAPNQEQLIIRNGSIRLRVEDIDAVLKRIRVATAAFGGSIDDLQVSSDEAQPVYRPLASGESADVAPLAAYATIRVPSKRLDEFTRRVATLGTVMRQSSSQSDVTQQHIDLSARLRNLRAEEARLREFLKAAKDVKEMLLVEAELSRVRGEIESLQGQLDYMDRQIEYATLSVELAKPAPVVRPTGTDWGFLAALTNGIQGAAGVVRATITIVIAVLPLAILALLAFFAIRAIVRRRSARVSARDDAQNEQADPSGESDGVSA